LIEAYAEILKKHPDARLTLIGDGPERYKVEALIDKFELQNKICLTGYLNQKEVAKRLSESDVFILPSFAEGVPVVLMEAMASGIPVVTTQIAGISELVEDGKSGFVTRPGDAEMLSLRILELLRKPKMCEQMGKVGRETVIHEYDSMKEAHWLLELIENRTVSGLRPNR
jgi:glycosyltransferase involved in cell wall biosynthesis